MPFPIMKSGTGTVLGFYGLGPVYTCTLIQDPEGVGPIKYMFMMVVNERGSKTPAYIVTCEHNEMQSELLGMAAGFDEEARKELIANAPPAYFCFFDRSGGHHIIEPLKRTPDADAFRAKALAFAASQLGIADSPVPIESLEAVSGTGMSKDKKQVLLVGGAAAIVVGVVAMFSMQPGNYDDCILENMKGVSSDVAARNIRRACRKKFPAPEQQTIVDPFVDPDELPKLSDMKDQ